MRALAIILVLGLNVIRPAQGVAQTDDVLNVYVYGNSLIHHLTDSDETTTPHWMAKLAEAQGTGFALDGQWGFLRDFAKPERPKANWKFKEVPRAWTRQYRNFEDVDWDVVMFNVENWVQYRSADEPFEWENTDNSSPLSAALAMVDRLEIKDGRPRVAVYEGWAFMKEFMRRFPPNARQIRKYQQYNMGEYHDWYVDFVEQLQTARPDVSFELIPVASVLAELLEGGVLDGMDPEVFYSDDGPHGTPTLYFLAGAITYVALFEAPLPEAIDLPDTIHEEVRTYYAAVRDEIHRMVLRPIQESNSTPAGPTAQVQTAEASSSSAFPTPVASANQQGILGLGLENPALSMGLNGVTDWSTQHPFIDRMKTARTWIGHLPGQWGGLNAQDLADGGYLDEDGWVWGIPQDLESIETLLFTGQPEDATGLAGRYRMTWQGTGTIDVTGGRARIVSRDPQEIWFDYTPGEGHVGIKIEVTDPERTGDYIHNIEIVAEEHISLHEAGAVFNPDWLAVVQDLRSVRFMDWMMTNGSAQSQWADRPQVNDFTWTWRGVPVEVMVQLANEIGADPWFTMPHLADEDYIAQFASYVHDTLNSDLKVFVEYSNELWNWGFAQAQWAVKQAEARWGKDAAGDAWMQFAGLKAAQTAQIWTEAFGDESEARLVRVVATHTDWRSLEEGLLQAPLWQAEGNPPPVDWFDAYAVTGYFGVTLGNDEGAPQVIEWLDEARAKAESDGVAQGLKRAALEAYVGEHRHDGLFERAAIALEQGDLAHMLTTALPYQAKVARDNGLALVMYEGGNHVVGIGEWGKNDALTDFFTALSTSPEMGALYESLLDGWQDLGGQSFNAFVDVAQATKWGSWGHLRHLWDETPRNDVLSAYNQKTAHWQDARAKGAFLHGGVFEGSDADERLEGTAKRDVLLAGAGNDILVARGASDLLHGGAGQDLAQLPGARDDYSFEVDGQRVRASAEGRHYLLCEIESVSFSETPNLVLPLEGLL